MILAAAVILTALAASFAAWRDRALDWRDALLRALVTCAVAAGAIAEILAKFDAIAPAPLLVAWLIATAIAGGVAIVRREPRVPSPPLRCCRTQILLLAMLIVSALLCGITAFLAATNEGDSLTYHMSRVAHWAQQRNIAFYPTHISRQDHMNPLAEILILHLQILAGSDHLANCVQWAAAVGCMIGASRLASRLRADPLAQIAAALLAACIPMGVMEASSTQNDLVEALWLVCLADAAAKQWTREDGDTGDAVFAAASLALAIYTKATAWIFAGPLVIWWIAGAWRGGRLRNGISHDGMRRAAVGALAMVCFTVALNGPFWMRNFAVYRNPLGPSQEDGPHASPYANAKFSPGTLVGNVARNLAIHLATPSDAVNANIETAVRAMCRWMGVDPDDPRTTWTAAGKFGIEPLSTAGNAAGNGLHLIAFVAACAALMWLGFMRRTSPDRGATLILAVAVVIAFLLFCGYLRWQPWHSRLQLPLFVLACPVIAVGLQRALGARAAAVVAMALAAWALPWMADLGRRPLIGARSLLLSPRVDNYFPNLPNEQADYLGAGRYCAEHHFRTIGLYMTWDVREYLIWVGLWHGHAAPFTMIDVNVSNPTAATGSNTMSPDAVIWDGAPRTSTLRVGAMLYCQVWDRPILGIYLPSPPQRLALR